MIISVKKIITVISCCAVVVFYMTADPCYAVKTAQQIDEELKQQEQQYRKIQRQINKVNSNIRATQKKEKNVTKELNDLSRKITITQQKVNVINVKMNKVQNNITKLTNDIKVSERNIKISEKLLKKRLIDIYKYGDVAEFNLLMSSSKAEDAMANTYLLSKIAKQDEHLIKNLREHRRKLTMTQNELKKEKKNLVVQNKDLQNHNKQLKNVANERNVLLDQVRRDKKLFIAQQAELQRASEEMNNAIKKLLAEKKRLRAEAKKKAAAEGKKESKALTHDVYYKGGRLSWPVHGEISSTFGTRVHPVFKTKITHTGLDIRCPKGTPVKPAADGEILYTGWMRGYGQVVIVDHGGDLTTVYAHLSKITTREDAKVTKGSVIGRVGSTGVATGNHLHFEVRLNGRAVNPMNYF